MPYSVFIHYTIRPTEITFFGVIASSNTTESELHLTDHRRSQTGCESEQPIVLPCIHEVLLDSSHQAIPLLRAIHRDHIYAYLYLFAPYLADKNSQSNVGSTDNNIATCTKRVQHLKGAANMSNMSYCRFQNTSNDLRDCVGEMEDNESFGDLKLSREEKEAFEYMRDLCKRFLNEAERLEDF